MARNRSTALIAIGAAVFTVGAALTFLLVRDDGEERKVTTSAAETGVSPKVTGGAPASAPGTPSLKVPADKEAVAIQVGAVPGLAGYAKVGDRVNVYGTFKDRQPNAAAKGVPLAKLVLADVSVLAVTAPPPGSEAGTATYLLAVQPGDAEKLIYLSSFEGIWLSITAEGAPTIAATPGRNAGNAS